MSEKYSDVVDQAMRLGEYPLATQLQAMPLASRHDFLHNLLKHTAWSPEVVWATDGHGQVWHSIDETLEKYAKLLLAAVYDLVINPHLSADKVLRLMPGLRKEIADWQTTVAKECLNELPVGYKDFRKIQGEQQGDHGDRVYVKTRAVFYDKLAEAWAETNNPGIGDDLMGYLAKELKGHFRDLVIAAVRKHDTYATTERVGSALHILAPLARENAMLGSGPINECFLSVAIRWIRSLDHKQILRAVGFQRTTKALSDKSIEVLGEQIDLLCRIEHVVKSLREEWKLMDSWEISSINPKTMEATLVFKVPEAYVVDRVARVKEDLKHKLSHWLNPDPAVTLQLELRGDVGQEKHKLLHKQRVRASTKQAA
ncbi:MAG TPA: hypothetical protein VJJ20_01585 [Candidatus Paceibacterota bacterium]